MPKKLAPLDAVQAPLSPDRVAAFRALRQALGAFWKALLAHSSPCPDGGSSRIIDADFHVFVERAFHAADGARALCWKLLEANWMPAPGTVRPHPGAGEPRVGGDKWEFKGDPGEWSVLLAIAPIFDSASVERPFAKRLRFHPLKPETMVVPADHVNRIRQCVTAIDSLLATSVSPLNQERKAASEQDMTVVLWEGAEPSSYNIKLARTRTAYLEAHGNVQAAIAALKAQNYPIAQTTFYEHLDKLDRLIPRWRTGIISGDSGIPQNAHVVKRFKKHQGSR